MEKGYVQVYTGNGKGKTTAAMGLGLRAVCAGYQVLMVQFMKSGGYSEDRIPSLLPNFSLEQFGSPGFITTTPSLMDMELAQKGFERLHNACTSGQWDVVIADEINVAQHMGLLPLEDVLALISSKHPQTELILTGRYAHESILNAADLATEMTEIKHYYSNQGVQARRGIEC